MEKRTLLQVSSSSKNDFPLNHKPLTSYFELCKRSVVGAKGFEPSTSCTPCKHASRTAPRPVEKALYMHPRLFARVRIFHTKILIKTSLLTEPRTA